MHRLVRTICIVWLLMVVTTLSNAETKWVPGEIIIQLKADISNVPVKGKFTGIASLEDLGLRFGLLSFEKLLPKDSPRLPNISKMMLLKFAETADVLELCRQYKTDPNVVFTTPNYIGEWHGLPSIPNDTYWNLQWGMFNDRLNLPSAWNIAQGNSNVVMAIIDQGIDTLHPDLMPNLWYNPNEIPNNGVDDDNNGFIDDIRGWNFGEGNNDIFYAPIQAGHGTSCAGIAGAVTNNSIGIAGVAGGWGGNGCKILGIRCAYKDLPRLSSIIQGIAYSSVNGVKVISMSYGFGVADPTLLQNTINDAYNNGLVLVASSGNSGLGSVAYPGACDNVIAVGATIQADTLWYSSNYGDKLDVVAPGGDDLNSGINPNLCELIINGNLVVNGALGDSVRFMSAAHFPEKLDWYAIRLMLGSTAQLNYCTIEHAYTGIQINGSSPQISNSRIQGCNTGIYCNNSTAQIKNNMIVDNGPLSKSSKGLFKASADTFASKGLDSASCIGTGIVASNSNITLDNNVIRNNFIGYHGGGSIQGIITNNTFEDNEYQGMDLYGDGFNMAITGNKFYRNAVPLNGSNGWEWQA